MKNVGKWGENVKLSCEIVLHVTLLSSGFHGAHTDRSVSRWNCRRHPRVLGSQKSPRRKSIEADESTEEVPECTNRSV